ncbi:MAG: hydrogenase nickel incorporation protein HypB [Bacteroidales bacterium]|nr:hydrogenase nickel incorporation protein HypB [Bacteroidales bacterium]
MCDTCGCGSEHGEFTLHSVDHEINDNHVRHDHAHPHSHSHSHSDKGGVTINVETDILSKNNLLAERNRGYFEAKNIKTFNLVSSPGSGKTTLLEKIIPLLKQKHEVFVIEGDQQTTKDAERIKKSGAKAIQINTGNGCHLDAHMISHAVKSLEVTDNSLLFIENVGNLVCPALFDLGESIRIVIASTTEGEDKPIKYPNMFSTSQICVLNKIDLLPHLEFNTEEFIANCKKVNSDLKIVKVSSKTSEGIDNLLNSII